jgi:hypothetical protein
MRPGPQVLGELAGLAALLTGPLMRRVALSQQDDHTAAALSGGWRQP